MRLTAPGPPAVPALLPPEANGCRPARKTFIIPHIVRVPGGKRPNHGHRAGRGARSPHLPIAADGRLDRMDKDPDEATLISPGYGRDFSGEKEHLMPGGLVTQGNGISSGTLMAMR
jgi:hypothetical protein